MNAANLVGILYRRPLCVSSDCRQNTRERWGHQLPSAVFFKISAALSRSLCVDSDLRPQPRRHEPTRLRGRRRALALAPGPCQLAGIK
jgi:hypothetical protein